MPRSTRRDEVDLWFARPGLARVPELLAAYQALLAPSELERLRHYRFERDRHEYLLTRALVRTVLARYREIAPAAWRFRKNPWGRPEIDPPCGLSFNLSNASDLVACAVCDRGDVGIDLEPEGRADAVLELAPHVFSPRELAELERLPAAERPTRALLLWTLKESYIKAVGVGLAARLESITFSVEDLGHIRVASSDPAEEPDRWRFRALEFASHRIAVARRGGGAPDMAITARETIPLCGPDRLLDLGD